MYEDIFINKLPYPINNIIRERYVKDSDQPSSLGSMAAEVRKYIAEECAKKTAKKAIKMSIKCCNSFEDVPQRFGCKPVYEKKKKKKNL